MRTRNYHVDPHELPIQSTPEGAAYRRWCAGIKAIRNSSDPRVRAKYLAARDAIIRDLGGQIGPNGKVLWNAVAPSAVHSNKFLSELSVKYVNEEYIADRLMPIVVVSKRSDDFATYDERSTLNAPDAETGPDGDVNEVERGRGSDNYSVKDYALKDRVSQETLDNQDDVFDEMFDMIEDLADSLLLHQEKRVNTIVMTNTNYPTGQKHTASTKWDQASGGTIVSDFLTAVAGLRRGSGRTKIIAACSIAVWNVIANNAAIKDLFKSVREGLATTEAVARYFGVDDILVGRAWQDTANIGASASIGRIWTQDNVAVLRVAERPTRRSAHFGSTFQHGARKQNQWTDPSKGPGAGVICAKVGHSQDHKIVANKAGYLIEDVLT